MIPRRLLCCALPLLILSSCTASYVARSGFQQAKILLSRRPLEQAPLYLSEAEVAQIALSQEATAFAKTLGLNVGKNYSTFVHIEDQYVSWLLMASPKLSFEPKTWCFPIVGALPYRGYFSQDSAKRAASRLERQGFDTLVRGVSAYSTLGWFEDPLFSNTLRQRPSALTNTIFHELFHATVWIPGSVPFNETAAQVFGNYANIEFARSCELCESESFVAETQKHLVLERQYALLLDKLRSELELLYRNDSMSDAEKLSSREGVFQALVTRLGLSEDRRSFRELNNAEILQSAIYFERYELFEQAFEECSHDPKCYISLMQQVAREYADDPFAGLTKLLEQGFSLEQ